jgi:hypothetical protein
MIYANLLGQSISRAYNPSSRLFFDPTYKLDDSVVDEELCRFFVNNLIKQFVKAFPLCGSLLNQLVMLFRRCP